jgi:transposase
MTSQFIDLKKSLVALEEKLLQCQNELAQSRKDCQLYQEKYEQSAQAYDHLLYAFKQFQRHAFGSKSERFKDNNISQGDFFSSVLAQPLSDDKEDDAQDNTPARSHRSNRKKRNKKSQHFLKSLPRREVIIPAENKKENDEVIRYEIKELLHYVPPVYEIIVQKREVIVSKEADEAIQLKTAPAPKHILFKAGVTESFLAHVIVSKIYDRQPLYHLEKQFSERFDFICPRNKLARWFIESSKSLQPIVNLLRDEVMDYDIAACDPTHLQVLNEPGRLATQKSYVYTLRGGPPERAVNIFEYQPDEHKAFLQDWFAGFRGYLQVDGQNIFDAFEQNQGIQLAFCHAHARRKFEPIAKASLKEGLAKEAMRFYKKLYQVEREAKNAQMSTEQRHQLRHEKSKPLMDRFEDWLREKVSTTLPQSPLGKAFQYVLKRQAGLRLFLEDGRLELDNNLTEQKNKDIALARKNFLFSYSVAGAHALCVHMSLVFTAIAHHLDPYHYMVYILQNIPHCVTINDYERLLPWNVSPTQDYRG